MGRDTIVLASMVILILSGIGVATYFIIKMNPGTSSMSLVNINSTMAMSQPQQPQQPQRPQPPQNPSQPPQNPSQQPQQPPATGFDPKRRPLSTDQPQPNDMELVNLINTHRQSIGLKPIAFSHDAWLVGAMHNWDLNVNQPPEVGQGRAKCAAHSWSNQPEWKGCCYDLTNPDAGCMLNKPKEITGNTSRGFQISNSISGGAMPTPQFSLNWWMGSPLHRDVIENTGMWKNKNWTGLGCAIGKGTSSCWFLD